MVVHLMVVPSQHGEPPLASSHLKRLEQETLNGLGFSHVGVKSFQTFAPAPLMKRLLAPLGFGSYNTAGLLIKQGDARGGDVTFLISACKQIPEREQSILLVQPFGGCSRAGETSSVWVALGC